MSETSDDMDGLIEASAQSKALVQAAEPVSESYGRNTTPCWTTLGSVNGQKVFAETGGMASEQAKYTSAAANSSSGWRWLEDV